MKVRLSDCLNKAANLIEKYGWRRYGYGSGTGPHCMVGALMDTCRIEDIRKPLLSLMAEKHLLGVTPANVAAGSFIKLYRYNDAKNRTKEQVVKTLRRIADLAA